MMRVALLNLPVDSNYGGNLQRFALVKTMQALGVEVEHIQLRFRPYLPWWKVPFVIPKRLLKRILVDSKQRIFEERYNRARYNDEIRVIENFYNTSIPHTKPVYTYRQLEKTAAHYDAYVVGSDQVWRKKIAGKYLPAFFLDFLGPRYVRRVAYAVSFGVDENELDPSEIKKLGELYKSFSAVSVREQSGLRLLSKYAWNEPQAIQLLDPTFLVSKDDYLSLTRDVPQGEARGKMVCYILDMTDEKRLLIETLAKEKGLESFIISLESKVPVEVWLRYFADAAFVLTDSYHGTVFSLIFNRPFRVIRNSFRGNARFESLLNVFNLSMDSECFDWQQVNQIIRQQKVRSLSFLQGALCPKEDS